MAGTSIILQERDRRLIKVLSIIHVLDRVQAELVGPFSSVSRANRRLTELVAARMLRRIDIPAGRVAFKAVYALPRHAGGGKMPAARHIPHQLALADAYLAFSRPRTSETQLRTWGGVRPPLLGTGCIPDAEAIFTTPSGHRTVFVEVDMGTEALSVWRRKAERYLDLARSGEFTRIYCQERFQIVVVAPSARRAATISAAIAAVTPKLFWMTDAKRLAADGPYSSVWLRPGREERVSLLGA